MPSVCHKCGKSSTMRGSMIFHNVDADFEVNFYSNAFVLDHLRNQQCQVELQVDSKIFSPQDPRPSIGLLRDDITEKSQGERFGKNILDSFALIFARQGYKGVVATAMEWGGGKQDTYTLYVSRNDPFRARRNDYHNINHFSCRIKQWFSESATGSSGDRDSHLWITILENCKMSIYKSVSQKCIEIERKTKLPAIKDWIKDQYYYKNAMNGLLGILDLLMKLFSNKFYDFQREDADKITMSCFEFLESNSSDAGNLFNNLDSRLIEHSRTESENEKRKEIRNSLRKVRRLIYETANYRRAWHDIVCFKAQHCSATLQIRFLPDSSKNGRYLKLGTFRQAAIEAGKISAEELSLIREASDVYRLPKEIGLPLSRFCPGCYYAVQVGETPGAREMVRVSRTNELPNGPVQSVSDENRWISNLKHCEMQVLEFLLTHDNSKFFDYIGCSKGPCWLCYHTLVNMTSVFEMRQSHLKLYSTWEPPDFRASQVQEERFAKVLQSLGKEMEKMVTEAKEAKAKNIFEYRLLNPDCPDVEKVFVIPPR